MKVIAATHALCGERLAVKSFQQRDGELCLVAVLPDGTPGLLAADVTDVFGEAHGGGGPATVLSVAGVRRLRLVVEAVARDGDEARRGR